MSKGTKIARWVLAVLLGGLYVVAGLGKFGESGKEMFAGWGYAPWFTTFIGAAEVAGGIGLIVPKTTRLAAGGLTLIMLGAAYTHLTNGEGAAVLRPIIFLALLGTVVWLHTRTTTHDHAPRVA